LTNPSEVKFKQFIDFEKTGYPGISARTSYFLLFSIFEWKEDWGRHVVDSKYNEKYLGAFNNFYKISESKIETTMAADSIKL
jgi:hypothetical protein